MVGAGWAAERPALLGLQVQTVGSSPAGPMS